MAQEQGVMVYDVDRVDEVMLDLENPGTTVSVVFAATGGGLVGFRMTQAALASLEAKLATLREQVASRFPRQ